MSWASAVPAAIDALVTAVRGSADLSGVQIEDGPQVVDEGPSDVLSIGFITDDGSGSAQGSAVHEGLSNSPTREQFSINCAASVVNGDGNIGAARRRAYALVSAVGKELDADKTLGGVVLSSVIGTAQLMQDQTPDAGALVTVVFSVDCDAFSAR